MKDFILCLLNMLLLVCGQILFKFAAHDREISSALDAVKLMLLPQMIASLALYAGATLLWVLHIDKNIAKLCVPYSGFGIPVSYSVFIYLI